MRSIELCSEGVDGSLAAGVVWGVTNVLPPRADRRFARALERLHPDSGARERALKSRTKVEALLTLADLRDEEALWCLDVVRVGRLLRFVPGDTREQGPRLDDAGSRVCQAREQPVPTISRGTCDLLLCLFSPDPSASLEVLGKAERLAGWISDLCGGRSSFSRLVTGVETSREIVFRRPRESW